MILHCFRDIALVTDKETDEQTWPTAYTALA